MGMFILLSGTIRYTRETKTNLQPLCESQDCIPNRSRHLSNANITQITQLHKGVHIDCKQDKQKQVLDTVNNN